MRMFKSVTNKLQRKYILAYWRYLLGWEEAAPSPYGLPWSAAVSLRLIAYHEAKRQMLEGAHSDHRLIEFHKKEPNG